VYAARVSLFVVEPGLGWESVWGVVRNRAPGVRGRPPSALWDCWLTLDRAIDASALRGWGNCWLETGHAAWPSPLGLSLRPALLQSGAVLLRRASRGCEGCGLLADGLNLIASVITWRSAWTWWLALRERCRSVGSLHLGAAASPCYGEACFASEICGTGGYGVVPLLALWLAPRGLTLCRRGLPDGKRVFLVTKRPVVKGPPGPTSDDPRPSRGRG
jgi:hypothetical protein